MRILLITLGSHGDVHPFVGLALALKMRGHMVALMTSGYFADLVQQAGLDFVELGSRAEFEKLSDNPDLWHARKGFSVMAQSIGKYLPRMYEKIAGYVQEHPDTFLVGSTLAFAARMVQEKTGTPLVTVHLSPSTIRSVHDMMKVPGVPLGKNSPTWMKRAFFAVVDWAILDRHLTPALNRFRATIGLPPAKRIVAEWWHSPQKVIGLWPAFFAPPQVDWPADTVLTGFPLWDETGVTPMSQELEAFLSAGPPPVVFTPGSAMRHGDDFFREAVKGCELAGVRGILLTRHRRHIPARLPDSVAHFDYAPFSQILPRCSILVHHGGIGTTAQALATATRQIIVPFSFDQFDNAERSWRLGAAEILPRKKFRAQEIALTVKRAQVESQGGKLAEIARKIRSSHAFDQTCAEIEAMGGPGCA